MKGSEIKFIIEEKNDLDGFKSESPSYRVSIRVEPSKIILLREFFKVGFNSGEKWDGFYFNNENGWDSSIGITRATFMTKNFDPNYLKQKEEELIKLFYKKLIKSEKNYVKEIKKLTERYTEDSEFYRKCQEVGPFKKLQRKEKLKQIPK